MQRLKDLKQKKQIFGMIHLQALPGTPGNKYTVRKIKEIALNELEIYKQYNLDGLIIENMHDIPYMKRKVGPEICAVMAVIAAALRKEYKKPLGIQVLAGANKVALAIAKAAELDFIRAEGFIFSHIADEGLMNADAATLLRYRKAINATNVKIFSDIKKKHSSHFITNDLSISDYAQAAQFFLSDGLIITGKSTAFAPALEEVKSVRRETELLIIIGSGITFNNIEKYWDYADIFIVGSHFKKDFRWFNELSEENIAMFMNKVEKLRN